MGMGLAGIRDQRSDIRKTSSHAKSRRRKAPDLPPFQRGCRRSRRGFARAPAEGGRGFVEKHSPQRTHRTQRKNKPHAEKRRTRRKKTVILRGAKRHRRIQNTGRDKSRPFCFSREGAKPRRRKAPFPKGVPAEGGRGFVEKHSPQRTHRTQRKNKPHAETQRTRRKKAIILRGAKRHRRIQNTGRDKSRPYALSPTPLPQAGEGIVPSQRVARISKAPSGNQKILFNRKERIETHRAQRRILTRRRIGRGERSEPRRFDLTRRREAAKKESPRLAPFSKGVPAEGGRGFVEKDSPQRTHSAQRKKSSFCATRSGVAESTKRAR